MKITTQSAEETIDLGWRLGQALKSGGLIELTGDLGSGKTTLIKGIAKGLGIKAPVSSPTFTISRVYDSGNKRFYHFDFYRIESMDMSELELNDALAEPDTVVAIEWSEHLRLPLPKERLAIKLVATGQDSRSITLNSSGQQHAKLLETL